ncbi:MAG: nicotinate phosphoribosyltransferase [Candidatus Marinimicrobia bacterium]|nr:nicotinate phosphoribosyltransferase [Candidatus Neomarinimicrobiota bacterium]
MKNLELLTDFYELTMAQGYFYNCPDKEVVFDYFVRKNPFQGGYMVFAGLAPLLQLLEKFQFSEKSIEYLKNQGIFGDEFLDFLANLHFDCDVFSIKEGDIFFPNEPAIIVKGNIIQAQLIETIVLNVLNFQSLIATKTSRIIEAAKGRGVLEFGLRRAQGIDGSLSGTRASIIGGCVATSNTLAGSLYHIPVSGTMAHSWVMSFRSEDEAFEKYAEIYPQNCILLVDTYDTLQSGLPKAIPTFKKLQSKGNTNFGIRLDSGNMEILSKNARKILDDNNLQECKIFISNELDEQVIADLLEKKCPIDAFGVGTKLITAHPDSSLAGVYKLAEISDKNENIPVIKISDSKEKQTNPGFKNIIRYFDSEERFLGDILCLAKERNNHLELSSNLFDKHKTSYQLLYPVMKKGKTINFETNLMDIQIYHRHQMNQLPSKYKKLKNPAIYPVKSSQTLEKLKQNIIDNM